MPGEFQTSSSACVPVTGISDGEGRAVSYCELTDKATNADFTLATDNAAHYADLDLDPVRAVPRYTRHSGAWVPPAHRTHR